VSTAAHRRPEDVHRDAPPGVLPPGRTDSIADVPERLRLLLTLLAAQVCGSAGQSLSLAVGSIVAADITGSNTWTGLPVAVGALGGALASVPLSRAMGRHGRRPGLAAGYALAVLGCGLGMAGVVARSFALLLVGMTLFGVGNAANLLARFAAADVAGPSGRGRAIGLVVGGGTLGSIVGPNLLDPAERLGALLGVWGPASAFLIGIGAFGLAALLTEALLRPDPLAIARRLGEGAAAVPDPAARRSVRAILARPRVRIAFGALMTAQLVMIGTTSTAAVYLHGHGHHTGTIGVAVSLHLAGMFAASPLTGWLCDRVGRLAIILAGGVVLLGAVGLAAAAPGSDGVLVSAALFLNGLGWNFAFVAGSALLTDALAPDERPTMQGFGDLASGLMGALGSTGGGIILQAWGFVALNAVGALLLLGPLAAIWLRRGLLTAESARPARA
jgi:MFS family permease